MLRNTYKKSLTLYNDLTQSLEKIGSTEHVEANLKFRRTFGSIKNLASVLIPQLKKFKTKEDLELELSELEWEL